MAATHFGWQRHLCNPLSFAAHRDQADFPIEVVQREGNHFAGSQAKTSQQEQKGVVSFANAGFSVTRGQDLLDLFSGKKPWHIGERPCGDGGNARRQVDGHDAAKEQVAQKGP